MDKICSESIEQDGLIYTVNIRRLYVEVDVIGMGRWYDWRFKSLELLFDYLEKETEISMKNLKQLKQLTKKRLVEAIQMRIPEEIKLIQKQAQRKIKFLNDLTVWVQTDISEQMQIPQIDRCEESFNP